MLGLIVVLSGGMGSATAEDAFVGGRRVMVVQAEKSPATKAPQKSVAKPAVGGKEVPPDKSAEVKNFAAIWILLMLVGVVVWMVWLKGKAFLQWAMTRMDDEAEQLQEPVSITFGYQLRSDLIAVARKWQEQYRVSPANLSVIAGFDTAMLLGMSEEHYADFMQERSFVAGREVDLIFERKRYLVKACRQADRSGSSVKYAPKAQHLQWDILVFLMYDADYALMGAWRMSCEDYKRQCDPKERLTPEDYQQGERVEGPGDRMESP
ncbi:MAG: hypothetical protein HQM02_00510 [Magnetococcales bacterium]|nr:hypothetical protein [Magnetococcales bacterium]